MNFVATLTDRDGNVSALHGITVPVVAVPPPPSGVIFADDFETCGYIGVQPPPAQWLGGGSGNVFVGPDPDGGCSLHLIHRGKPAGNQSTAEQRFTMAAGVSEFWMEYDFYLPANFYHRPNPNNTDNNKFLALWERKYADQTLPAQAELFLQFWPASGGNSNLTIGGNRWDSPVNRPFGSIDNFFTDAERGRWNSFRLHMRLASTPGTADGVIEVWWNGVRRVEEYKLPLPAISDGRFLRLGYLLGWATAAYAEDTHFKIDNIRIHASNPGW